MPRQWFGGQRRDQVAQPEAKQFERLLHTVCFALAMKVCRDGEGVTKVVRLVVTGAKTEKDAKQVAKTVGTSSLVKTALFGEDANWGRIRVAALGRAGVSIIPHHIALAFDDVLMVRSGMGLGRRAEQRISRVVRRKEFTITLDLGQGSSEAQLWTTDLSYEVCKDQCLVPVLADGNSRSYGSWHSTLAP